MDSDNCKVTASIATTLSTKTLCMRLLDICLLQLYNMYCKHCKHKQHHTPYHCCDFLQVCNARGIYVEDSDIGGASAGGWALKYESVQYGHICRSRVHHSDWCFGLTGGLCFQSINGGGGRIIVIQVLSRESCAVQCFSQQTTFRGAQIVAAADVGTAAVGLLSVLRWQVEQLAAVILLVSYQSSQVAETCNKNVINRTECGGCSAYRPVNCCYCCCCCRGVCVLPCRQQHR
jgi:hypothetical protein